MSVVQLCVHMSEWVQRKMDRVRVGAEEDGWGGRCVEGADGVHTMTMPLQAWPIIDL